ncbi:MAG: hypothetical protein LBD45_06575 [Bacteroidales bacterium]|jgi:hypothetical protein|nr:hypothetical protein [Bacteroidales bacterium]
MIHSLKTTAIIATMALLWIEAFSQDMKTSSDINRYANSVLGLNDTYAASLANYRKLLSDADGKFTAIRYGGVIQSMPIDCSCLQISQNKSDDLHTKMSNVSDFMWKNELNGLIQAAESASQRAVIQCSYLNNYFVNSEYYNDRSNQLFDRLKADFVAAIRDASSSWNTAVQASVRASRGDYSLVANSYGSSQQAYGGNYSNSNYSTGSGYASSGGYGSNSSDYANLRSSSSYANTYGGAPYTYPYGNYTKGRSDNSSSSRSSYSSRAQRNANQGTYYSSANRSYGNYGSSSYGSPSYGSNYSGSSYGRT